MKNAGLESGGPNIGLGKRKKNCQSCHLPVPLANNPSFSSSVFFSFKYHFSFSFSYGFGGIFVLVLIFCMLMWYD